MSKEVKIVPEKFNDKVLEHEVEIEGVEVKNVTEVGLNEMVLEDVVKNDGDEILDVEVEINIMDEKLKVEEGKKNVDKMLRRNHEKRDEK